MGAAGVRRLRPPAIDAISDIAVRGKSAVAVGAGGMILASSDGGATWQSEASPVTIAASRW